MILVLFKLNTIDLYKWIGVKYVITVKTGSSSLESYNGNVGINIVSRNFDTGFIKLDSNIAVTAATKSLDYKPSKVKCSLFKRNQKDVFEFEDQDIRTVKLNFFHLVKNSKLPWQ